MEQGHAIFCYGECEKAAIHIICLAVLSTFSLVVFVIECYELKRMLVGCACGLSASFQLGDG